MEFDDGFYDPTVLEIPETLNDLVKNSLVRVYDFYFFVYCGYVGILVSIVQEKLVFEFY